ncbi:MAG TPA: NADH-quinone oxidoreductase subunit L [Verrucomicrobiales bacterium]|nr:NADH-quinone oxidoreductase subunit L [Verrucomicrobiales bacterium]
MEPAWFLLLLPLLAAAVIILFTRKWKTLSSAISVGAAAVAFLISLGLLGRNDEQVLAFRWMEIGDLRIDIGILLDGLSRSMMFTVTTVGLIIHIYSLGYMRNDEGKSRYFAGLSLFMFSMTGIVLAENFIMMFIFWELVGVSSYVLIGHWFTRNPPVEAAKKAFITNRIGDFGFLVGILLIWSLTGSLAFSGIQEGLPAAAAYPSALAIAVLCLFCGAVGKSAQLPLHVWLPDAMEGPTPVSALIHAATMVAAGVYMLARIGFLLAAAAPSAVLIAWIGGLTALFAAVVATQQDDIKRILAYSTLSQLGYMIMAAGLLATQAAMFHLFTHAFFKALLFLGAGAVIHACHHEQNIWKMGGLRKNMPLTFATFAIGTAALVAVPYVTSGFFSKEYILDAAWSQNGNLFWIAAIVAFLTPFYMIRLLLVAFFGRARSRHVEQAREVPLVMGVPLLLLAVPSIAIAWFSGLIEWIQIPHPEHHATHPIVLTVSILALLGGGGLAILFYRERASEPFRAAPVADKFYFDELYDGLVRYIQGGLASLSAFLDRSVIDGIAVKGIGRIAAGTGYLLRLIQVGNIQAYAFLFGMGVILTIFLLLAL